MSGDDELDVGESGVDDGEEEGMMDEELRQVKQRGDKVLAQLKERKVQIPVCSCISFYFSFPFELLPKSKR